MQKFIIAGLKVVMEVKGQLLASRSEKYLNNFKGKPDIEIIPSKENKDKMKAEHPTLTDDEVEYLVTGGMFYFQLLKFDGMMIHSSCVAFDGKAYLFTADSGTGKSTHTALWQKYLDGVIMINDDKPAVRLVDGVFYAMGTPWSGKTDQNSDIAVPISSIVILKRGAVNKIYPASPIQTVPFLMRQTMFPSKPQNTDRLATLLDKLIPSVNCCFLECDISEAAVKTSFERLTGQKYIKRK